MGHRVLDPATANEEHRRQYRHPDYVVDSDTSSEIYHSPLGQETTCSADVDELEVTLPSGSQPARAVNQSARGTIQE